MDRGVGRESLLLLALLLVLLVVVLLVIWGGGWRVSNQKQDRQRASRLERG